MRMNKPWWKRITTLMAAALLVFSCLCSLGIPASAEEIEYERTDSYVINYAKTDLGEYAAQAPYLYASPHLGRMAIRDLDSGKMVYWWITSQQVYNMINTTKLVQGGEGAYASIETYCVDACIDANSGSSYQRINLEDSAYFSDETAGKLRAIFLNSFPYIKNISTIEAAVNAWLETAGTEYAAVSGLTGAEAITATQIAIWTVANGMDVEVAAPYYYTDDRTAEDLAGEVVYTQDAYVDCTEAERDTTENNIQALYAFLLDLDAQDPSQKVVSNAAFTDKDVSFELQENGTYTATVTVSVDVAVDSGDDLVLSAVSGEHNVSTAVKAGQSAYELQLTGLSAPGKVNLEINGTQTAADVFLFDASGERSNSQSMIGYDNSTLPVHAETTAEPDRILNFYKTTEVDGSRIPLENIVFDIYKAAELDAYTSGQVTLPEAPTAEYAAENYTLAATVTTGTDGKAVCNLTQLGQTDGVYLIVERDSDAIIEPAAPFYVSAPMTNNAGDGWIYSINIEPKNQVVPGPEIGKDVTEIDNDSDTFDVDQTHTWIIRADVPADLADGKVYTITDTLDYRLTYIGNTVVTVALNTDMAGEESITLTADTDYTLNEFQTTDDAGNTVDAFTVSLTPAGMIKAAETAGENYADYEVRVYFDASINSNASMGESIPNQAELAYTNSVGYDYAAKSDDPVVYTGGVSILKYDAKDETLPLAGAEFKIARLAADDEISAGLSSKIVYGGQELQVVFAEFYTDTALQHKASTVTTGSDGKAVIYGLAYGTYYLVETKAPDGYNLLSSPVQIPVGEKTHETEAVIKVANSSEFTLPNTGDTGVGMYVIVGSLVLLAAGAMLLFRRRIFG